MTDISDEPNPNVTVMRIVGGRLAGKEYPLSEDRRTCIGHGLGNDVVLRGAGTRGGAVELRLGEGSAALRVLSGSVELLGRSFGEGDEATLPPYLPFRFGEHLLAYGERESERWTDAAGVATSPCVRPVTPLPAPRLHDRLQTAGRSWLSAGLKRVTVFPVAVLTAGAVAFAVAAGPTSAFISDQIGGVRYLERAYEDAGYRNLKVSKSPSGGLVVSGSVDKEADLMRVRAIAQGASEQTMIDVSSAASLADAATDILTAHGVDAQAHAAGLGGISIQAPYLPADKQDELRTVLKRDLPDLRRVSFKVDDSRGEDPLQTLFASSGTGLATVVEDPGHIVTADGSRWFPGAILPTGHRLVSVEGGRIRFEKNGRVEELRL